MDSDDAERNTRIQYAKNLLQYFVEKSFQYYGDTFNVSNVHNLIRIADNARRLECPFDDISCFQFENCFQFVNKRIGNTNNPIAKITKRLKERDVALQFPLKALKSSA